MARTNDPSAATKKAWETRARAQQAGGKGDWASVVEEKWGSKGGKGAGGAFGFGGSEGLKKAYEQAFAKKQDKPLDKQEKAQDKDGSAPTPDDKPIDMPAAAVEALRKNEKAHAGDTVEQALIITASGEVLERSGEERSVTFGPEDVRAMRGGVVTHNHPSGRTFSPDDINMLVSNNLKEIRAVAPDGTIYRFGQDNTNRSKSEAADLAAKVLGRINLMRWNMQNEIRAGRISTEEANAGLGAEAHAVMLELTKIPGSGFYYKRTRGKSAKNS